MRAAETHASGRSPAIPRVAIGVKQNSSPHATISINSHSRKPRMGIGNQPQLSRRAVTVGLYTARNPVVASSKMCNAKATHSANHAPPKPEVDNAGGAGLKESPCRV